MFIGVVVSCRISHSFLVILNDLYVSFSGLITSVGVAIVYLIMWFLSEGFPLALGTFLFFRLRYFIVAFLCLSYNYFLAAPLLPCEHKVKNTFAWVFKICVYTKLRIIMSLSF